MTTAYLGGAGFEEPVKAEPPVIPDGSLQLIPGAVPQLVRLAQNEPVLFSRVGLALVGAVLQLQLLLDMQAVRKARRGGDQQEFVGLCPKSRFSLDCVPD